MARLIHGLHLFPPNLEANHPSVPIIVAEKNHPESNLRRQRSHDHKMDDQEGRPSPAFDPSCEKRERYVGRGGGRVEKGREKPWNKRVEQTEGEKKGKRKKDDIVRWRNESWQTGEHEPGAK